MGRQRKYFTEEERLEAQRERARELRARKREAARHGGVYQSGRRENSILLQKESLWNSFRAQGCSFCEEAFPGCIDAHHIGEKTSGVSELVRFGTVESLTAELEKCIPVCANCHRKLHLGVLRLEHRPGEKQCGRCFEWLPESAFELKYDAGKRANKRRATCRLCRGKNKAARNAKLLHR